MCKPRRGKKRAIIKKKKTMYHCRSSQYAMWIIAIKNKIIQNNTNQARIKL